MYYYYHAESDSCWAEDERLSHGDEIQELTQSQYERLRELRSSPVPELSDVEFNALCKEGYDFADRRLP